MRVKAKQDRLWQKAFSKENGISILYLVAMILYFFENTRSSGFLLLSREQDSQWQKKLTMANFLSYSAYFFSGNFIS